MFRGLLIIASTIVVAIALLIGVVAFAFHRVAASQKEADASWQPTDADAAATTKPSTEANAASDAQEAANESQSIELWAKDAVLHGEVKLVDPGSGRVRVTVARGDRAARRDKSNAEMSGHPVTARLTNFHDNDDSAEWTVQIPKAGEYEIDAAYACPKWNHSGHFVVKLGDKDFPLVIESTRSENSFRVVTLGKLSIKAGKFTLLVAPDIQPGERVFLNLRSIQLIPAS